MSYRLQLLGRPSLTKDGAATRVASRKGMALLIYLAAHPKESFPRSHLCALLWSDKSDADARRNFYTMVSRLRSELSVWPVRSERDRLGWDPAAGVAVDAVEVAEQTAALVDWKAREGRPGLAGGDGADAQMRSRFSLDALREFAEVFRGPFCEGFYCDSEAFEEWLEQERSMWEVRALALFDELVALEASGGRWSRVLEYCRRALAIDYFQESFHRWIMTAHAAKGDRSRAIAHYEEFCGALKDELDAEPDPATIALVHRIKSRPAAPEAPVLRPAALSPARSGAVFPPISAPATPLVGRGPELDELLASLVPPRPGESKLVLVHGEAGIGKTRLIEEVVGAVLPKLQAPGGAKWRGTAAKGRDAAAKGQDAAAKGRDATAKGQDAAADGRGLTGWESGYGTVLLGHCAPYGDDLSYAPIVECIATYLERVDPAGIRLDPVWWRQIARLVPAAAVSMPGASLVSEPGWRDDRLRGESLRDENGKDQGEHRLRLLQAIARFVGALPPPVLLVVEDLHWADNATLDALAYLLRQSRAAGGLAVLATARGDAFSPQFNETLTTLERAGRAVRIALRPLSESATRELVDRTAQGAVHAAAARIHAESGGNPLYILELVRFLSENRGGAEAPASGDGAEHPLPVPPTVERVVAGRLAALSPEARDVLAAASIFPRGAPFFRLLSVCGISEEEALSGFETLSQSGFLRSAGGASIAFNHEIVRRAVERSLSAPRRILLHRRAFELLSRKAGGAGAPVEQLAYHAREGELWDQALHWYEESARAAEAVFAYSTACRRLDQALACLEKLEDVPERLEMELRLRAWRLRLGYWFDPGRDESWRDALEEQRRDGVIDQLPEVLLATAETLYLQGDMTKAEPILRRVLEQVGPGDDPVLFGYAVGGLGALEMFRGDLGRAIDLFTESTTLTEGVERRLPGKSARLARAACYAMTGNFTRAESEIEELARTEEIRQDKSQAAYLHATEAMAAFLKSEWDRAIAAARLGMAKARAAGHRHNEYYASIWLGAAIAEAGDPGAGIEALEGSARLARDARTWIMLDWVHAFRSLAYLGAGDLQKAKEAAAEGLRLAEEYGFKLGIGLCTEALGRLAAKSGDLPGAAEALRQALRLYSAIGAQPYFDRCRLSLQAITGRGTRVKEDGQGGSQIHSK